MNFLHNRLIFKVLWVGIPACLRAGNRRNKYFQSFEIIDKEMFTI